VNCYSDGWLGVGGTKTGAGLYKNGLVPEVKESYPWPLNGSNLLIASLAQGGSTQPVYFDLDHDGLIEVVFVNSAGSLVASTYSATTGTLAVKTSLGAVGHTGGNLAIYGVYVDNSSNYKYVTNSTGLFVAVPSASAVKFYKLAGGTFTLDHTASLSSANVGKGVSCYGEYCYTQTNDHKLVKMYVPTNTVAYSGAIETGTDTVSNITPVISSDGTKVFTMGTNGSRGYICQFEASATWGAITDECIYSDDGSSFDSNFAKVTSFSGGFSKYSAIKGHELFYTLVADVSDYEYFGVGEFYQQTGMFTSVYNEIYPTWQGPEGACISAPVSAICNGVQGVAISRFNDVPGTYVAPNYRMGRLNYAYNGEYDPKAIASDFDFDATYELYASTGVITGLGSISPAGMSSDIHVLDTNNDGEVELWTYIGDATQGKVYVFGSDLSTLATFTPAFQVALNRDTAFTFGDNYDTNAPGNYSFMISGRNSSTTGNFTLYALRLNSSNQIVQTRWLMGNYTNGGGTLQRIIPLDTLGSGLKGYLFIGETTSVTNYNISLYVYDGSGGWQLVNRRSYNQPQIAKSVWSSGAGGDVVMVGPSGARHPYWVYRNAASATTVSDLLSSSAASTVDASTSAGPVHGVSKSGQRESYLIRIAAVL
jgi:hypothetical protein